MKNITVLLGVLCLSGWFGCDDVAGSGSQTSNPAVAVVGDSGCIRGTAPKGTLIWLGWEKENALNYVERLRRFTVADTGGHFAFTGINTGRMVIYSLDTLSGLVAGIVGVEAYGARRFEVEMDTALTLNGQVLRGSTVVRTAKVHISGTPFGTGVDAEGRYRFVNVPASLRNRIIIETDIFSSTPSDTISWPRLPQAAMSNNHIADTVNAVK